MKNNIYLDYAATTPLKPKVKDYIIDLLDDFYNPSSQYQDGANVRAMIRMARCSVADFIGVCVDDVVFTSSGSASNTLAITGYATNNTCTVYHSPTMHKSALKAVESLKDKMCIKLKVGKTGMIDYEYLSQWLKINPVKPFVVMEYANSEIGTIQLVYEIIKLVHEYNGIVYLDCTGAIPYIEINNIKLKADMIGFSAHKLGALKGTGVLYYNRKKLGQLKPLVYGSQENGLFGGTENVIGICALQQAIYHYDYDLISSKNRDYVLNYIRDNIENAYLVGSEGSRLPNNLYVCIKCVSGEALMILLDEDGIQISTGSACNAGSPDPSTTLLAIGMPEEDLHSCIRMTFSGKETKEELDYVCEKLKQRIEILRKFS